MEQILGVLQILLKILDTFSKTLAKPLEVSHANKCLPNIEIFWGVSSDLFGVVDKDDVKESAAKRSLNMNLANVNVTLFNPGGLMKSFKLKMEKTFGKTEAIHTADVIGDPENVRGQMDTFVNGGRLQPECFTNENDISQCEFKCKLCTP